MHLTSDTPQCLNETENNKGFFDYLPIELFKRVHKTLKAQPATLRGKYRFLKAFETTFAQEIGNYHLLLSFSMTNLTSN